MTAPVLHIRRLFAEALFAALPAKQTPTLALPELTGASAALAAIALHERHPHLLLIVPGENQSTPIQNDLQTLQTQYTPFPEPNPENPDSERYRLLLPKALQTAADTLIVTTLGAILAPIPDPKALAEATLPIAPNSTIPHAAERLSAMGYERIPEIDSPGQFAMRGGILDIWPPDTEQPVRIELFGDEVDTIRLFDPTTQRSTSQLPSATIPPRDLNNLPTITLDQILPGNAAILWLDPFAIQDALDRIRLEQKRSPDWRELRRRFARRHPAIEFFCGDQPPAKTPVARFELAPFPGLGRGDELSTTPEIAALHRRTVLDSLANQSSPSFVCADTDAMAELLRRDAPASTPTVFLRLALSGGFVTPSFSLASQGDLTAAPRKQRQPIRPICEGERFDQIAELEPGDLVVHLNHGIGRFLGTREIAVAGGQLEVFTLEYADGQLLHVPVSHIHLLSKYVGVAGKRAKLHRLDGRRWLKEKAEAQRGVEDLAAALLETQARRDVLKGFAFDSNPPWLAEFEAAFPYSETPDQLRVIAEIKADMAKTRPMDRLVCGDAGYGKTEVAMRAAFIAVMNHKQVAVLVPTTVLAEQHFQTFRQRMEGFPIKVSVVSRLRSQSERLEALRGADKGQVDILIGTHALLQEQVSFKDLGLLIVDEEQRFGVAHKERLKRLRGLVDVLTLTATPIPRTLYLGMTGARDMSLLRTAPANRQPVETRIVRDTDTTLQSAIRQELHRKGQVYFLYNRVRTIPLIRKRIQSLVPEATVGIAHGQMEAAELAAQMEAFACGKTNVLICTTLVENGLDIPSANTIIVHRADRFGIADLYQLRGRVGRSAIKARAWFLLPESGAMDLEARERIRALKRHAGLGTGFNLALRDLEIRGAGNLLGTAQSGHIAAIGFGLYCQLLKQTVARLKGEKPPLLVDVSLALDFVELSPGLFDSERSACLPYDYVDEEIHRTGIHRRLAEATDVQELKRLGEELADRYGKLPEAVRNLIDLAKLRILAAQRGITRIEVKQGRATYFDAATRAALPFSREETRIEGSTAGARLRAMHRFLTARIPLHQ